MYGIEGIDELKDKGWEEEAIEEENRLLEESAFISPSIDYGRNDQHDPVGEALLAQVFGDDPPEITEVSDRDKILFEDGDIGLEHMADEVHQVWCMWMEYMFSKGLVLKDGGFKINPPECKRWKRQMVTPYAQLPEDEKQSDRDIARRYLNIAWAPQIEAYEELEGK